MVVKIASSIAILLMLVICCRASQSAESIVDKMSARDLAGQMLMVGIPADAYNHFKSILLKEAIADLKIGGFMLNSYHASHSDSMDKNANAIVGMIDHIQRESEKENRIPSFISADNESIRYSSVKNVIRHHPSFLTLAATQNGTIINAAGIMAGQQLMGLGVNVILGPNLDVDYSIGDSLNGNIMTRSFGDSEWIVGTCASHYISGLRKTGIVIVAKHFPDLGHASGNVHRGIPEYHGGARSLARQVELYRYVKDVIDGAMTSHQYVPGLSPGREDPVTFSKRFATDILRGSGVVDAFDSGVVTGVGLAEKVIITDDLSSMESALVYKNKYSFTYADMAINAIEAGHDIVLFSHIDYPGRGGKSFPMKFDDLRDVVSSLENYIKSSDERLKKARRSVSKILKYKFRLNDSYDGKRGSVFRIWQRGYISDIDLEFSRMTDDVFTSVDDFVKKSLRTSSLVISGDSSIVSLKNVRVEKKVSIFVSDKKAEEFKKRYSDFNNIRLIIYSDDVKVGAKARQSFNDLKNQFKQSIESDDLVVYVASSFDDKNIISIVENYEEDFRSKIVVFLHESPRLLSVRSFLKVTVVGNFSQLPEAYVADCDILDGVIVPEKHVGRMSVSLYPMYETDNNAYTIQANGSCAEVLSYRTRKEVEQIKVINDLSKEINRLKSSIVDYKDISVFISASSCFILLIVAGVKLIVWSKLNLWHRFVSALKQKKRDADSNVDKNTLNDNKIICKKFNSKVIRFISLLTMISFAFASAIFCVNIYTGEPIRESSLIVARFFIAIALYVIDLSRG